MAIQRNLNDEWSAMATGRSGRRAVRRWALDHPVLESADTLGDVLDLGRGCDVGPEVRRALVALAATDDLAARTLLQGLLGGLCNMARAIGRDRDALDEIVSLAWERIRTYPQHRTGSVSGNVIMDVRKRYMLLHTGPEIVMERAGHTVRDASAEDRALGASFVDDLAQAGAVAGVSNTVLSTIVRSRVEGESMADLAEEQQVSLKVLWHRRWRGEARLRALPLAG